MKLGKKANSHRGVSSAVVSLGKVSVETKGGAGYARDWLETRYNGVPCD